jgi:hypothetical protein
MILKRKLYSSSYRKGNKMKKLGRKLASTGSVAILGSMLGKKPLTKALKGEVPAEVISEGVNKISNIGAAALLTGTGLQYLGHKKVKKAEKELAQKLNRDNQK